mgnify:FL=1
MPAENISEWLARELAAKERAYTGGNLGALRDVITLCGEHNQPLPEWATKALLADNAAMLTGKKKTGEGRHGNWLQKYQDDMKDLERYETVKLCREYGIPWSLDKAYKAAALILEGSYAGGSASTIKTAYSRVKKRQDSEPGRYHILKSIRVDLRTAQKPSKRRAEIWAKVRAMSKTPEKMG